MYTTQLSSHGIYAYAYAYAPYYLLCSRGTYTQHTLLATISPQNSLINNHHTMQQTDKLETCKTSKGQIIVNCF